MVSSLRNPTGPARLLHTNLPPSCLVSACFVCACALGIDGHVPQISEFQGEAIDLQPWLLFQPGTVSVDSKPSLVAQFDELVSATNVLCAGTEGGKCTSLERAAITGGLMSCCLQIQCLGGLSLTNWTCTVKRRLLKPRTVAWRPRTLPKKSNFNSYCKYEVKLSGGIISEKERGLGRFVFILHEVFLIVFHCRSDYKELKEQIEEMETIVKQYVSWAIFNQYSCII